MTSNLNQRFKVKKQIFKIKLKLISFPTLTTIKSPSANSVQFINIIKNLQPIRNPISKNKRFIMIVRAIFFDKTAQMSSKLIDKSINLNNMRIKVRI